MTKKKNKSMIQRRLIPTYIFLAIVSLISVFPFYWMIMAATNNYVDVSKGKLTFGTYAAENFRNLISQQPLGLAMKNSFIYALCRDYVCVCKDGAETSEIIRYDRHGDRESDTSCCYRCPE